MTIAMMGGFLPETTAIGPAAFAIPLGRDSLLVLLTYAGAVALLTFVRGGDVDSVTGHADAPE